MSRHISTKQMIVRNYLVVASLLALMAICSGHRHRYHHRHRVKRLSSPIRDERTEELSKYIVSIRSRTARKYYGDNHFCCGCIVSPKFVLTSAHCVMDRRKIMFRPRVLLIVAGTPNRLKFHKKTSINSPVKQLFVPRNFTMYNRNDIAVVRLALTLPTDNMHIGFLKLPMTPPIDGDNHTVLGWGRIYERGPMASMLLHVDVELLPSETCVSMLNTFTPDMMCAGNLENNLDESPCPGDTGAPLIKELTVYGVVSYHIGCGKMSLPSVYTSVWHHIDWIERKMMSGLRGLASGLSSACFCFCVLVCRWS